MKKSFGILILLVYCLNCQAQVWVDKGATWYYNFNCPVSGGFIKVQYTEDTVIQNRNCQKLVAREYSFMLTPDHTIYYMGTSITGTEFTTVSGDTVFRFYNNRFTTLYNFGAQPGDSWDLDIDTNSSGCSNAIVFVDSVGTININNQSYRWIYLRCTDSARATIRGRVLERFGAMDTYLFPQYNYCNGIVDDCYTYDLYCFKDSSFSLYNTTGRDCEYYLTSSEISETKKSISIFPNPSCNFISIMKPNNFEIQRVELFDLRGLVLQNDAADRINIKSLDDGYYTVIVTDKNGFQFTSKLIKITDRN